MPSDQYFVWEGHREASADELPIKVYAVSPGRAASAYAECRWPNQAIDGEELTVRDHEGKLSYVTVDGSVSYRVTYLADGTCRQCGAGPEESHHRDCATNPGIDPGMTDV